MFPFKNTGDFLSGTDNFDNKEIRWVSSPPNYSIN